MVAFSVLIASYNYERYLRQAIESVLCQTYSDFELLIIDDNSQDGSLALAASYASRDARIRVLRHPDGKNHGLPATLQLGLSEAKGEYIAFLESDDLWLPDCLECRLRTLRVSGVGVVFNAVQPLFMPGARVDWFYSYIPRIMREHHSRVPFPESSFCLADALLIENKIPTFSCSAVRADLLRECDMKAPVPRWLDWWVWSQLARKTEFCFSPLPLTRWRLHPGSLNHEVRISRYISDSRAMWRGFRERFRRRDWAEGKYAAAAVVSLPFWFRIGLRFCMIASACGLRSTLLSIRSRYR